ncbi:2-amino-4-hydroxy-6-hydroxymethyldihydropteridine diphosphokinase [Rickettsiales bacterium LUAb2]
MFTTLEEQCFDTITKLTANLKATNVKQSKFYWSLGISSSKLLTKDYINIVIECDTNLTPLEIINTINELEKQYVNSKNKAIKITLLDYNSLIKNNHLVKLPFPKLHEKAYIVMPLFELNPKWWHPILKQNINSIVLKVSKNELLNQKV